MRKYTTTGGVSNKQAMVVIGDKKGMSEGKGKAVQDETVVTELVATAKGGSGRGGMGGPWFPPPPPPLRERASAKRGGLPRALSGCSYSDTAHISMRITGSRPANMTHSNLQLPKDNSVAVPHIQRLIPKGRGSRSTPIYSKTSNNGPSEKRTTSVQRTAHLPPIDFIP